MSFLNMLREARFSPSAAFQQFALQYPKTKNEIHAFVEGRDDPSFYLSFILRVVPDINKIHLYRCKNKRGVYDAYSKAMPLVKKPSFVLFFVDKDHSDLIGENYETAPNIYVTDLYSIENYVVSEAMFRRIWEDFFNTSNFMLDYDTVASKFKKELNRFYEYALPLSAWIVFNRRKGLKPNVNNVKLNEIYTFNQDLTIQFSSIKDLFAHLDRVCGINCAEDLTTVLPLIISELAKMDPKKHIRGKYELWFFIKFIEKMIVVLKDTCTQDNESFKVRTQIGEANAVEILGPRVQMPESLKDFFQSNGLVPLET